MGFRNVMDHLRKPLGDSAEGADIKKLAAELGVVIPGSIDVRAWSLPILVALLERIKALEGATENPKA